jgi:polar amino acid transport system substrate-binding protein
VVTKPIDPAQLFSTLARWIKAGERELVPEGEGQETDVPQADELLHEVPGIDLATGLTRVAGNRKLFRRILLGFRSSNSNTTDEIKQALDNGDLELAQRLVHTVKGVSGNIAADDLYNVAADLEQAIRKGKSDQYDALLEDFSEKLAFLIASIAALETESKELPALEAERRE